MVVRSNAEASATASRSDLVLLCGGTESRRAVARSDNGRLIDHSDPVVVGDLESLLRCAPLSRAVIVCGELVGLSADVVERLVCERAPHATLVRGDEPPSGHAPAR